MLKNHQKNSQISNILLWRLNTRTAILSPTVEHRSSLDRQFFAMTQSSVNNFFKNNQSSYSSDTTDSVIYSELSFRILKYLRINVVWKHWYSLSHSKTFNESHEASTSWDIKNVKQLQHWVKQNSEVFLEDLNSL